MNRLSIACSIILTDYRLHCLAKAHRQHRYQKRITADDAVSAYGVISSVILQIAVHDDIDHTGGDVHDERCHSYTDDGGQDA